MYCKKCGKEIPDDSIYCNHCGTRQTPKKIVVEFSKPSLPSMNEDSVRNGIFSIGRCLKRCIFSLKPLAISLLIIGLITGAIYGIAYYSYYLLNIPPKASVSEINLYREKGITSVYHPAQGKWPEHYSYNYENPSKILPDCKWDMDDDMMGTSFTNWFNGDSTNINVSRTDYLKYKSGDFASSISLIAFCICLLYYFIRLCFRFRKWLYKK